MHSKRHGSGVKSSFNACHVALQQDGTARKILSRQGRKGREGKSKNPKNSSLNRQPVRYGRTKIFMQGLFDFPWRPARPLRLRIC
jgi:hypothetical protein